MKDNKKEKDTQKELETYKFDTSTFVKAFSFSKREVATGKLKNSDKKTILKT